MRTAAHLSTSRILIIYTCFCDIFSDGNTMGLQALPPELISHILSFLPELSHSSTPNQSIKNVVVGPNIPLTPAVCRTSHVLRREALPLYAKSAAFSIQADEDPLSPNNRVRAWLDALGDEALGKVISLQLSRHWKLSQPTRWQGHVGFYVRLQWMETAGLEASGKGKGRQKGGWNVTTGTYPIANDMRGMRLESVNLLRENVVQRLRGLGWGGRERSGLGRADVEFVVQAMEVVATHPIEAFDVEQSEQGRRARRRIWERMEEELLRLGMEHGSESGDGNDEEHGSKFFTPY